MPSLAQIIFPMTLERIRYAQRVRSLLGSSLVAYWPLDDPSGTVARDRGANGYNGTYSNVTLANKIGIHNRPVPLFNGGTSAVDVASIVPGLNVSEGTILGTAQVSQASVWTNGAIKTILDWEINSSNRFLVRKETANNKITAYYFAGGTNKNVATAESNFNTFNPTTPFNFAFTWSKSGEALAFYINGLQIGTTKTALGSWTGTINFAKLGNTGATDAWDGWLYDVAVANRPMTAAEVYTLSQHRRFVFDGDSRTGDKSYPGLACTVQNRQVAYRTVGVAGGTVASQTTAAPAAVDALYKQNGIVIIWGGMNDCTSVNAATIYSRLQTYCAARRTAGWKVVVCSEIDAQDAARNAAGWHGTILPALNALLDADHSFADGYANLGANANLMDATNTTYFDADLVHLTAAGYQEVANAVGAVLASM